MSAVPAARAILGFGERITEDRNDADEIALFSEDEAVPPQLGGVKIIRLIGEGGMGRVYLGRHAILDLDVAVKVMHDRFGDRARFLSEARLAAKIRHPHIVGVHHAGIEHGFRFLVMDYVAGKTLKQLVKERGRLPWREAAGYILQAAQGLAAAHRQAIIHRDVKPSNMLLDAAGCLKVADLGLARFMVDAQPGTVTGQILGTAEYMAPEQAREPRQVTPAADVYALGASLYHLIAGKVPFGGAGIADILVAHRTSPVPDLRREVPDLPPAIAGFVKRLLAKDPIHRPADGSAVVSELEHLLGLATVTTAQAAAPAMRSGSRRRFLIGASAAAAMAMVLVGWSRWNGAPPGASHPLAVPPAPHQAPAAVHPPAAIQAPAVADPWQTPPRAVFALTDKLPAAVLAELDAACLASGLPVVERQRIDSLVREQDLVASGHADPATAGRIGRLVGGHIAIFATAIEDRVEVRTVLVESGEVVSSRFVAPGEAAQSVGAGIAAAIALLPVQGRVTAEGGRLLVSAGTRQGLRVGDRLDLRRDGGGGFAQATVTAVERDRAVISVQPPRDDCGGALAVRPAP